MLIQELRQKVRADLESPVDMRRLGTGWVSGVAGLLAAVAGLFFVLCLRYPSMLTVPPLRAYYGHQAFRLGLHFLLIGAFAAGLLSLVLRVNKILGFAAITLVLLATILGGSHVQTRGELTGGAFLGLD